MTNIQFNCDRCGKAVNGTSNEFYLDHSIIVTDGFYDLTKGGWEQFAKTSFEKRICDACMFNDPKYIEIYGDTNSKSLK